MGEDRRSDAALTVGLAVGLGTGSELAAVFEQVVAVLARCYSVDAEIVRSPRTYHSYASLRLEGGAERMSRLTHEDAAHYEEFSRDRAESGTPAVFRTAINAQSLYLVRQRLQAVKVDSLSTDTSSILLVRDQAQGFYAGDNVHDDAEDVVVRTLSFSRELTERIVAYALERARRQWGADSIRRAVMVYKYHLLDGVLDSWVRDLSARHGIRIDLVQPDTANRNLISDGVEDHTLLIGSNEWADIMHVVLLDRLGLGPQENRFSENVYLHPQMRGLVEYQTVHGSADDLAGRGVVNPVATMRAAAAILERHGACEGAERAMNQALRFLSERGIVTPDLGGRHSTMDVVHAALDHLSTFVRASCGSSRGHDRPAGSPMPAGAASTAARTALLVMDFQNDFCTKEGIGAEYRGDMSRMAVPAQNIPRVVDFARERGIEVIFVQFIGDAKYQGPSWRRRDHALHKRPKCREGTWGAAFYRVSPAPGERIFQKRAHFDAFLSDGFERYLREQGFEHLVLTGVYSDVCVDSTARTAFQKGYHVTVISDCTTSLHLRDEDVIRFMRRLYGARIVTHDEFFTDER